MLLFSAKQSYPKLYLLIQFPSGLWYSTLLLLVLRTFKGSFCRITFLYPPSLSGVGADLSRDKSFPFACLPKKWVNASEFEFCWECKNISFRTPVIIAVMVIVGSDYFSLWVKCLDLDCLWETLVLFPLWCCEAQISDTSWFRTPTCCLCCSPGERVPIVPDK